MTLPDALVPVAHELATRFFVLLSEQLTEAQWKELGHKTRTLEIAGVCHSHDHCDANQVMLDAYEEVTGTELNHDDAACVALVDVAWDLAKLKMKEIQP